MPAHLKSFLNQVCKSIEQAFDKDLPACSEKPHAPVINAMRYSFLAGGKRIRPALVRAWSDIYGVPESIATQVGLAIECIHTYSLIHDDLPCMDDDILRRGKPTCHVEFNEYTAVLAGDALQALAFEILSQLDVEDSIKIQLIALLSTSIGAHGMVGGQMWDMLTEESLTTHLSQDELFQLQSMKTGALIITSCQAGAILAQTSTEAATAYGKALGALFQITDDLLDISEHDIGKTSRKDEQAGKTTFVSLLGAQKAEEMADQLLEECLISITISSSPILKDLAHFVRFRTK